MASGDYVVEFHPKALKEPTRLDKVARRRVVALVGRIRKDPRGQGEAMKGPGRLCKYRVGQYRVIAAIEDDKVLVTVVRIGSRGQVYRDNA